MMQNHPPETRGEHLTIRHARSPCRKERNKLRDTARAALVVTAAAAGTRADWSGARRGGRGYGREAKPEAEVALYFRNKDVLGPFFKQ